jgi:hypothetical protein
MRIQPYRSSMPISHEVTETASPMMPSGWASNQLGASRSTLLRLEEEGLLHPIRLGKSGHRRYSRVEVLALAAGTSPKASGPAEADTIVPPTAGPESSPVTTEDTTEPKQQRPLAAPSVETSAEAATPEATSALLESVSR